MASPPATTDSGAMPAAGEVFEGKYRIERVLGAGGMGVVLAAMHLHLQQRVAIKLMRPELAKEPATVERFVREGRAAVKIKSEHVARVLDVGVREGGEPYIVMEFLEGADLGHLVETHGPLPVPTAVDYVTQACEALAEAHAHGIVHRDVKPSNLFLTTRADGLPCVKVLDFGIAKATLAGDTPDGGSMTRTDAVVGSPLYMAPERMRSATTVDPRTDIWSLGVILFELVSGEFPFDSASAPELCAMILRDPPRALRSVAPKVPEALEAVVMRCLEKDPDRRFGSVAELAAAIEPFGPNAPMVTSGQIARALQTATASRTRLERALEPTEDVASARMAESATTETWTGGKAAASAAGSRRLRVAALGLALGAGVGLVAWGPHLLRKPVTVAAPSSVPAAASDVAIPATTAAATASEAPPMVSASNTPEAPAASAPIVAARPGRARPAAAAKPAPAATVDPFKRAPDRHD
jgi:serine/threonine-protein kinase